MKKKLCLVEIQQYMSRNEELKYKYIFLDENNKALTGFSDTKLHEDLVNSDLDTYESAHARTWEVQRNVWDGKLTYSVMIDGLSPSDT